MTWYLKYEKHLYEVSDILLAEIRAQKITEAKNVHEEARAQARVIRDDMVREAKKIKTDEKYVALKAIERDFGDFFKKLETATSQKITQLENE